MPVELTHLRCFVAVAEELHFGRAAERLFMTQPPLSRQIRILETALGIQLFERSSRNVILTDAGRAYYDDATRILRMSAQAAISAQRVASGEVGRVTLGFTAVSGYHLMPQLIASARSHLAGISIALKEMSSTAQTKAIEAHTIDLGIIRSQYATHGFSYSHLVREPLLIAMPKHHPLARKRAIAAQDLEGAPFVMYSSDGGNYFHHRIEGLLMAAGVRVNCVQYTEQTHTIIALVRAGIGLAIVPASARHLRFDDIVYKQAWTPDAYGDFDLVWSDKYSNPAVDQFRIFTIDYFTKLAKLTKHSS